MQLTESQKKLKENLEANYSILGKVMLERDRRTLQYLRNKEWHKCCPNVKCEGYSGSENETLCPHCNTELLSLI